MNILHKMKVLIARKDFWQWLFVALSLLFMALFIVYIALRALHAGVNMATYAADGTFQLYNPLRRLAAGEIIGHDFPFFHGVGVPLLHYPVFYALGENVFAAETAKWFVSPVLFLGSTFAFFFAYFRNFKKTTIATALFTIVSIFYIDIIYPGNSLIGVRSTIPVLVAAAVLWRTSKRVEVGSYSVAINDVVAIILLGVAVACGTEQGLAAIVAYMLVKLLFFFKYTQTKWRAFVKLTVMGLAIGGSVLAVISIITAGHAFEALHYALIDIPSDQSWYFGTPPNEYLTWQNLLPRLFDFSRIPMWVLFILSCLLIGGSLYKRTASIQQKEIYIFAMTYGVVVFLVGISGYYAPGAQLIPLERMAGLISIAFIIQFTLANTDWLHIQKDWQNRRSFLKFGLIFILLSLGGYVIILNTGYFAKVINDTPIKDTAETALAARHKDDYFASDKTWKARLDAFHPYIKEGTTVWSTYTSIYDSQLSKTLNPSKGGEDYIIHALGHERREAYARQFVDERPEYVITLKPTYFIYEEWLWSRNWDFYRHLVTNYDLTAENDAHLLWRLKSHPSKQDHNEIKINEQEGRYPLPSNTSNKVKVYQVTINYGAASGMVHALDKIPRYMINANTSAIRYPIALPPNETTWKFPIIIMPGESNVSLQKKVDGIIPFASLEIHDMKYKQIDIPYINTMMFVNNYCSIEGHHKDTRCLKARLNLHTYKDEE